jgi:hypothetical protein
MTELHRLADGDDQALERAIPVCLAGRPASPLATAPLSC